MQTSMTSQSKLRMKVAVPHHLMLKDGSNIKFSRKSPELEDQHSAKNSSAAQDEAMGGSKGDRKLEEIGYDSSSSFEFRSRERSQHPSRINYLSSRPIMPSKWNDAEKWILNKQNVHLIRISNKTNVQNRPLRATPDSVKRADFSRPETGKGKFEFDSFSAEPILGQGKGPHPSIEVAEAGTTIRSPEMRDIGTEMTPIPSQEPSRSPTPGGATTPLRSPVSTPPSTPQRQAEAGESGKELSEQEKRSKITKEIIDLGVHLGKMNIVAWASKDERERKKDEGGRIEYRNRAAAWEEAERSKHEARFKREEIRIQAGEIQQKAKLEARTKKMEVRIEQMSARAEAKMVKKMASARAAAQARKARQHQRIAAQAQYIRRTGRIPSNYFTCCR